MQLDIFIETNKIIEKYFMYLLYFLFLFAGRASSTADKGVPDMTCISDIDEIGINRNLKVRYERDEIYVSFSKYISIQLFICIIWNLELIHGQI